MNILVEQPHPEIRILILNRPEKRNAMNLLLMQELLRQLQIAEADVEVRALIIKGAGQVFCAGLDLTEATDEKLIKPSSECLASIYSGLYNSPLITIAAVHGTAAAGGAGLAAACDFILATDNAFFSFPEVRRGLVAAQVGTLLYRQLPMRQLRELLLLAQPIDAKHALSIGLINRVVDDADLIEKAIELTLDILKGAPGALTATKQLLRSLEPRAIEEDLQNAIAFHRQARSSEEAHRNINAFLNLDSSQDSAF